MAANVPSRLIMISAMYENGGNTTHRLLDGHPELHVYPFESQLGTLLVADYLSSLVPLKYRWPEFPLSGSSDQDYELFYDEEMKVRLRSPFVSKFRDANLDLGEADRKQAFVQLMQDRPRTRGELVTAFFQATFQSWHNMQRSGQEKANLGYSPVVGLDAEKIFADLPDAQIIHVVRNPYSGYADTKKRPFPLSLSRYTWTWNFVQHLALTSAERYPDRFHILRFEDLVADTAGQMDALCQKLGLSYADTVTYPSWNGEKLESIYPWGTIRKATSEANVSTMNELLTSERDEIKSLASVMLKLLNYGEL